MTYEQVEEELKLIKQIKRIAPKIKRNKDVRFQNNREVRAWRLNIRRNLDKIANQKIRLNKDLVEELRYEIKGVNNWLEHNSIFNFKTNLTTLKEQVISQDDIFFELWDKLKPLTELSKQLPPQAQEMLDGDIANLEDDVETAYQNLVKWQSSIVRQNNVKALSEAKDTLHETQNAIEKQMGFNALRITTFPTRSKVALILDEGLLEKYALTLVGQNIDELETQVTDFVFKELASLSELNTLTIKSTLNKLLNKQLDKQKSELFYADWQGYTYKAQIDCRLHFNKLNKLLYEDYEEIPAEISSELESYQKGSYDNTIAHVNRINEIAEKYGTLSLEVNTNKNVDNLSELTSLLKQLSSFAQALFREDANSKHGIKVVKQLIETSSYFGNKTNYQAKTFNQAYDAFILACDDLENWINSNWYQAGGVPNNHKKSFPGDVETYKKPGPKHVFKG